ncbi:MAG: hypothetical protein HY820_24295 [Acidobacteria bacterium]|nr:hypothetical protein [Acidobacteriota bacterium]
MGIRSFLALLLSLVLLQPLPAVEPVEQLCGTHRGGAKEEVFLHRRWMAVRNRLGLRAASTPAGKDIGDIAVMFASGGVLSQRNPFNLAAKGITFTPASGFIRYRYQTVASSYDDRAADNGSVLSGMQDEDSRRVGIPFRFPFFGKTYPDVYINSNGDVTFGDEDTFILGSDGLPHIGPLAGGPPRIAALLADLDPSKSSKGIRVFADSTRVVITWLEVPLFGSGVRPLQTFQLRLYPDGHFETAYPAVSVSEAVVGISPGGASGTSDMVSFLNDPSGEYTGTLAELFTTRVALDTVLLSQRFYQTHEDAYDYLAVYNTMGIGASAFAVSTELSLRTTYRTGFGDTTVDYASTYGSPRRLQAFLNMGFLTQYPADPFATVPRRGTTGDTPLSVLAHEAGHLFLALASIREGADGEQRPMLTTPDLAHWDFPLQSEASFLGGNRILDSGEGSSPRFTTTAAVEQFSPLDQYLMGVLPPEEVPPFFLVRNSGRGNNPLPQKGVSFNGARQDIRVENLISAEGRRSPDHTVAQRRFRMAIILLIPEGTEPVESDVQQVDLLRSEFERYYAASTGGRVTMETGLRRNLHLSVESNAGMVVGSSLNASIAVDRALATPLAVSLQSRNGLVTMPGSVVIPAGATRTEFAIRGNLPGVEDITASVDDPRFITSIAKLQVAASADAIQLQVISGDTQTPLAGVTLPDEILVRATDVNLIPYPGQRVSASVTAPGTVTPETAVTDEDGIARFRWTPGPAVNQLSARLASAAATVTATLPGKPFFRAESVLNAASFEQGIAAGSLVSIFGVNLAAGESRPNAVRVLLNGEPCIVVMASDGQIQFVAPRGLAGDSAVLSVTSLLGDSGDVEVPVFAVQPGLFYSPANGEAQATVQGFLTSQQAALPGDILEMLATGLGPLQPSALSSVEEVALQPQVTIGGVPAEVVFAGMPAPKPGVYIIRARVPEQAPQGNSGLQIAVNGIVSNTATITVATP